MPTPSRRGMIAAFRDLDTNVLKCRDWGHLWDYKGADEKGQHFYCPRCEKKRIRELDGRGFPMGNRYPDPPEGYAARPGIGWSADARAAMRTVLYGDKGRL